ncbi:PDZ domain-containing protein [Streptomyces sp. NPDC085927]|uniref:PDZ domain-containing protein n=1 Tax=Streptomyces sp. NPDC085927 TaxID=3365738 RepID=UPI0037D37C9E
MEQTALRPKPMPGRETAGPGDAGGGADRNGNGSGEGSGGGAGSGTRRGSGRPRPHAARRRGRRLRTTLLAMLLGTVLVLSGVGVGAMGATVVGVDALAGLQHRAGFAGTAAPSGSPGASGPSVASGPGAAPSPASAPVVARLGVEVVDDSGPGALVVGVHVPGPGFSAGLVRGDVLLAFGDTRTDTAADLARAVLRARPGAGVTLTVRHSSGGFQQLTAVPGLVT